MKKVTSLIIIAAVVLSSLVFTTGCTKKQEVDLSEYLAYEGFSGFATLEEQPVLEDYETKYDDLKEKRKEARLDDDDSKYDEYTEEMRSLRNLNKALECVKFKLVKGENGKLANGDTVKITAKYDEDKIDKYDVSFVADEFETKVKGLEEKEVVDPFDSSNFVVTYSGLDGEGSIKVGSKEDDSDYTIYYNTEPSYNLKNGDKVTVTATLYDEDYILKDSEDGEVATKELTVEGLGEIPEKLSSSVDSTVPTEAILEELENDYPAEVGDDDKGYHFGIENDNYTFAEVKINKVSDFKLEKTLYGYTDDSFGKKSCVYAQIYSRTFTVKMVDPSYSSKVKKGAVKNVTAYYIGFISGGYLMVSDNKLVKINDDYSMYCSTSAKESATAVQKYFEDSYKSNYTITEVK
ncbi:MAG: hypothetical protein ACI4RL_04190 [Ruminococcus sp.]